MTDGDGTKGSVDGLMLMQERRVRAAAVLRTVTLRDEATRLRDDAVTLQCEVARLHVEIVRQRDEVTRLHAEIGRHRDEITRLHAEIVRQQDYIEARAAAALEDRRQAAHQIKEVSAALREMTADRDRVEAAWHASTAEHHRLLQSAVWRATAPLRWVLDRIPASVRRLLRLGLTGSG